ncbi:MAG: hypothetical protein HY043_07155 [Verrucomicrobia bacterium]|nr:hypothetical protein [Verrucomicrobiota bacterium]
MEKKYLALGYRVPKAIFNQFNFMKTKLKRFQITLFSAIALAAYSAVSLTAAVVEAGAVPAPTGSTFTDANWSSMGGLPGANQHVLAAVVDDSGNLYIAGYFSLVGDVLANRVAKWDGKKWTALGSGISGSGMSIADLLGFDPPVVYALAVSGTNLYVGGSFTLAGDVAVKNIAKWDGNKWSALETGLAGGRGYPYGSYVAALTVSGSDVYVGGAFTTAGGIAATNIVKWNGTTWSAMGSGMDQLGYVSALAVAGNEVYAGGSFTNAGGVAANFVAKWGGNSWSALGSGMKGYGVYALTLSGNDVYAGGQFTSAGGTAAKNIAKWNGSIWSRLGSGLTDVFPDSGVYVSTLAVSKSNVYAGGTFTVSGGSAVKYFANWDGNRWNNVGSGVNDSVETLAVSGGDLYAGGGFGKAGESAASRVAKWDGNNWSALGSGLNSLVTARASSNSDLYAGGFFTTVGNIAANHIARWDGNNWSALGSGLDFSVRTVAVSGSDVYAGGDGPGIARWNGSSWSPLGSGEDGRQSVRAITVLGGNVYAGGRFSGIGRTLANNIAKWDGNSWSTLGTGMEGSPNVFPPDGYVSALAVLGSNVYAGGNFTKAGGTAANNIARWDGSSWSELGSGINGVVLALAVSGSNLYVGGNFTKAGGIAANGIAKWDGNNWSGLDSGINGTVEALAVSGSNLYAGGAFTKAGGNEANSIAKCDGSRWSALGSGVNGEVLAMAVSGNNLYAGGQLTTAGEKVSVYLVRAYLPDIPALSVRRSGTDVQISWPSVDTAGFSLEQAGALAAPTSWVTNAASVSDDGTKKSVTLPATNSAQFFRLRHQ